MALARTAAAGGGDGQGGDDGKGPAAGGNGGAAAPEPQSPEPLYAMVYIGATPMKMAARRITPKRKYLMPSYHVVLVTKENQQRMLEASRNPIGGVNPAHPWTRLRHATLKLDVALEGKGLQTGDDAPVDLVKFKRKFKKLVPEQSWNPVWAPDGVPTLTLKQAKAVLKNYRIHLIRWVGAYSDALCNRTPDGVKAASRPNRGKPYVQDSEQLADWATNRINWLKKDAIRGIGVQEPKPPFGEGSRALVRRRRSVSPAA